LGLIEIGIADAEGVANRPAVYLLWPREGKPHLARTNVLRRRLTRTLRTLGDTIRRIEYQYTGSRLESHFLMWQLARRYLPGDYRREIRLRLPPYVKLILTNAFPRTTVTTHIGRAPAVYYGPFRDKSAAARFESEFLDLFQLRRCQEDLAPSPEHPGCMYGEMGRCLRPCQQAVGAEEYGGEANRVADFLHTSGRSLLEPAIAARERLSAEMDFEGAAMMHQRFGRIEEVLGLADEMARDVSRLNAITVTPSAEPEAVDLGWVRGGAWQGFRRLDFALADGRAVSLDTRLRETAASIPETRPASGSSIQTERMEQLAILARWFYSTWRDGEMLLVDDWQKMPWRKLVNAVSRVAKQPGSTKPPTPHPNNRS
jgi:excinuclease UvrABC nuclease subunit